ncbi:ribonuclease PH [Candidatus Velamenicoccus archaeovorus]|uniref:Ribonuclease PH n=1 Tax=Velamenicoccus archaeovorus TaxID=1930593 RepID=A0A410P323_VELA1|nr:ribonuclease PH [Candidatus Velamenicoccus archaeovorus]QAT16520.1 ribonuclease PH [Candidatus Velamenicoccus archaeovorus]
MNRSDGRSTDMLRKVKVTRKFLKHAEGSCLIEVGETKVICSASVEETVPLFLKGKNEGWVTAEYGMLPRSCETRVNREKQRSGRTFEIQRLVGRSLRTAVAMRELGERTITLDCDVIQADGGTRTASITGSFIALVDCLDVMRKRKMIRRIPITDFVAATSVGIVDGATLLDLTYEEDSKAEVDMNVVMVSSGSFIEIQGTAERKPFSKEQMDVLLGLAQKGITRLIEMQKDLLKDVQ